MIAAEAAGGEFSPGQQKALLGISVFVCGLSKQTQTFQALSAAQTKLFTDKYIIKTQRVL